MRKPQTYFEQIPVRKVKDMIYGMTEKQGDPQISRNAQSLLQCSLCQKPVPVETAKTDSQGRAIHEECYVGSLTRESAAPRTGAHNM